MASYPLPYVVAEAKKKNATMNQKPLRYLLSAMMAGALIAAILVVSLQMGQVLKAAGSPVFYMATSAFFGTALCTIIFSKTELFTSNVMYMSTGLITGQVSFANMLKSWLMVYVGNFLGVVFFVWLFANTGLWANLPDNHVLFGVIDHKIHGSFAQIFCKGILCNWIICLATWVPLRLKNEMARLTMIMLLVFAFFFSGYEHSIANMAFFGLSEAFSGGPALTDLLHNMIPATLGNIVGGAVFVAALNTYLERDTLPASEDGHTESVSSVVVE